MGGTACNGRNNARRVRRGRLVGAPARPLMGLRVALTKRRAQRMKQHYVPVMYTKAWVDPDLAPQRNLWRYRPYQWPRSKGPAAVGYEEEFYDVADLPAGADDVEGALGKMESTVAPHLYKLRSGKAQLTPQEHAEFSWFVALLMTRTQLFRERSNALVSETMKMGFRKALGTPGKLEELQIEHKVRTGETLELERIREVIQAFLAGEVEIVQSKAFAIKQMLEGTEVFAKVFELLDWHLLEAPDQLQFITSDQPVYKVNPTGSVEPADAMEVWFPISPRYVVTGNFRHDAPRHCIVEPKVVALCNRRQMVGAREIYAAHRSENIKAAFDRIVGKRGALVPLHRGATIPAPRS